jgi:hypothetical protein
MVNRWDDIETHFIQTNNSVEAILRKAGVSSWLENCGPTAGTAGCKVQGHEVEVKLPGGATIQPEDALAIWMNDPANVPILKKELPGVDPTAYLDNELIQYYPVALKNVFGAKALVLWNLAWDKVVEMLRGGYVLMFHLKKPRHYLLAVHFDDSDYSIIYRDSWPGRTGTNGFNLRMLRPEFESNVQESFVAIEPKA